MKDLPRIMYCVAVIAVSWGIQAAVAYAQASSLNQESAVHYSLYYENFKNKNYQDGLGDLIWILENDPGFPRGRDVNFERAVEIYEALAMAAEDPASQRSMLDSALAIFDRAVPTMQAIDGEIDEFEWTLDKGRFIQKHIDKLEDMSGEVQASYIRAYELDPMKVDPYYLDVVLNAHYSSGNVGSTLSLLRELNEVRGEEEGIETLLRKYFRVIPPDEQIGFLEQQLAEDESNVEVIQQLFELYDQEGYYGKLLELAPKVLELEPTPEVLRMLTRMYLEEGEVNKAVEVFNQMEAMQDLELVAQDYHNMGIAQQELENFREAREYYRQAVEVDPEYTAALRAVADLYATAASRCGIADREEAAVFWLIADAYQRAGDAAGAARMRTAFPTAEDVFYVQKWSNNEATSVSYSCNGLTISGTTTVRQR